MPLKFFLTQLFVLSAILLVKADKELDNCPFTKISTLSSPLYEEHVSQLRSYFIGLNCTLVVNQLEKDLDFGKRKEKKENKFLGRNIKIKILLGELLELPLNSTFLWIDATTVVLPSEKFPSSEILNFLGDSDLLVARESGKNKANIGVLLMRNTDLTVKFFGKLLSSIGKHHWDQGLACCMLNGKTKYNCKGIRPFRNINYGFFPSSLVGVEGIFSKSECVKTLNKFNRSVDRPSMVKLVGLKSSRDSCVKLFDKELWSKDSGTSV